MQMLKNPDCLREVQEQFGEQQARMLQRNDGRVPPDGNGRERQEALELPPKQFPCSL